ncbi:deoxynucleoside monophosphate kinase [Streptomyces phage Phredrick]|jgi:hypothetical protein|nr:deoxynucleoside monophosphate kinase [Streptomyces phage Phredrick]
MQIVGFSGYARSGKDTAAEALSSLGFVRISFADVLRDFLYEMNPIVVPNYAPNGGSGYRLRDVIEEYGWSGYKDSIFSDDIRRNLQVLGTDCGRAMLGDNVWVDALFSNLPYPDGKYAIADVRFPNEADGIRARGGKMYRIEREGIGPANDHFSEVALDHYEFDGFIHNDGSVAHFKDSVRRRILEGWV